MSEILEFAKLFEKLAQQTSAQAADIIDVLNSSKLLGYQSGSDLNDPVFDTSGPIADVLFGILDKFEAKRIALKLKVSPNGNVDVQVAANSPNAAGISSAVKQYFNPKMSAVLKSKKVLPAGEMIVNWLPKVGYQ